MIVKNLLVVGVVAGFATAAVAGDEKATWSTAGKIRMDAVQSTKDTKEGSADKTTEKSSEIELDRAQFTLMGSRGADSMEIKIYADKLNSDHIDDALNVASISHKWSDMLSTSFGKLSALGLSWENDYSSTSQYMYSLSNSYAPGNANGAQVDLGFGDHSLSLQVLQGLKSYEADDVTYKFDSKGGLTTTVSYRGEINKMIRPLISYSNIRTAGTQGTATDANGNETATKRGAYATALGAGVQVDAAGAVVDLELDQVKLLKQKDSTTEKDQNIQSIVAQVKYGFGDTTALVKIASDSHKKGADQGVGDITQTQFAIGAEHKVDSSCTLHAVYVSGNETTKGEGSGNDTKVTSATINLGVTAAM